MQPSINATFKSCYTATLVASMICYALSLGHNGTLLLSGVAAVAAIGGYSVGIIKQRAISGLAIDDYPNDGIVLGSDKAGRHTYKFANGEAVGREAAREMETDNERQV